MGSSATLPAVMIPAPMMPTVAPMRLQPMITPTARPPRNGPARTWAAQNIASPIRRCVSRRPRRHQQEIGTAGVALGADPGLRLQVPAPAADSDIVVRGAGDGKPADSRHQALTATWGLAGQVAFARRLDDPLVATLIEAGRRHMSGRFDEGGAWGGQPQEDIGEMRMNEPEPPFAPGDRVRLEHMDDDPDPIPVGSEGTVRFCRPMTYRGVEEWQVDVARDNGRSLWAVVPKDVLVRID